ERKRGFTSAADIDGFARTRADGVNRDDRPPAIPALDEQQLPSFKDFVFHAANHAAHDLAKVHLKLLAESILRNLVHDADDGGIHGLVLAALRHACGTALDDK